MPRARSLAHSHTYVLLRGGGGWNRFIKVALKHSRDRHKHVCAYSASASRGTTEEKEQQVGDLMMIMMMLSEIGSSLCPRCPLDGFVCRIFAHGPPEVASRIHCKIIFVCWIAINYSCPHHVKISSQLIKLKNMNRRTQNRLMICCDIAGQLLSSILIS
jgi:hypothetical protein